jgi:nifR3 family TIM-barrel protein
MEGITNHVYRSLAVQYSEMDVVCTEFVRLSGDKFSPKQVRDHMEFYPQVTLSVQLMGENPRLFAPTINYFQEMGVHVFDLNLGCPSTKVNRKGCGAAMLENTQLLLEVVKAMRQQITGLFSCKMRAGWKTPSRAIEIAQMLEQEGVDFLTIHPRTKAQMYTGNANWDLIAQVKENIRIPLIGNGDIFSPKDAKAMIEHTQCDGVMMGRGVLRDPFLIRKINSYLTKQSYPRIHWSKYYSFYQEYILGLQKIGMRDKTVLGKTKEHMSYFCRFFAQETSSSEEHWHKIRRLQQLEDLTKYLHQMLVEYPNQEEVSSRLESIA